MKISTEILVIGGGATGLGAARDAVLRGFKTILVEKGDLAHGTSGRYHGLLHSGARYVVRDPQSAADCYRENLILKRTLPSAIEDTGGFFVALPEDPLDYAQDFAGRCAAAGIPAEDVSLSTLRGQEPLLNPGLVRAFRVPDAACDSFDALHALAESVRAGSGEILVRHKVVALLKRRNQVVGAEVENILTGERVTVGADLVINCAGAWAGQIAGLGGCTVKILPGKGTMVAVNSRLVNSVVNRLKPPGDGDILVPVGTVAVIGTTEVVVKNPDQYAIGADEIDLLLMEGEKLIPRFREFRALRAWAGVRPLFQDTLAPRPRSRTRAGGEAGRDSRQLSRSHSILDHSTRDGVEGFISIVGGKFTTFRLMAQEALDLACYKLDSERPCRTADVSIDPPGKTFHTLGARLAEIESADKSELVCECELVTRAQVEAALKESGSLVLNDLRRDLRLGMGPCQAGFCAFRAAGLAFATEATSAGSSDQAHAAVKSINSALAEFLQERWKGLRPVMWGANLRQLELDLNINRNLLGADRLPIARDVEEYPSEKVA